MPAILMRRAVGQEAIGYLHGQLAADGLLQKELYECAEDYLVRNGIYDVTWIEEGDFRAYKKELEGAGTYTRKQVLERTVALRNIQKYWIEKEYGELLREIEQCTEAEKARLYHVERFLIRQGIHHIREMDYPLRERFEAELSPTDKNTFGYLKVFDRIKQHAIRTEMKGLPGIAKNKMQYKEQVIFLPYLPDQELAKDFDKVQDKQELVWDFAREAPDKLKRQVFQLLDYILGNVYPDNPKERRVRFLLPLRWLYDFCTEKGIEDIECLELGQIQAFEQVVASKVVNVRNAMQIVDNSRKFLFLSAKEIHWHANVWYMERFHFQPDRLNPSNPVQRITFLEVKNRRNRALLQEYAKYLVGISGLTIGNVRIQLYDVKRCLQYFDEGESICLASPGQMDSYFRMLQEKDIKDDTFNINVSYILKFFRYLKAKGYIGEIPFEPEYYFKKTVPYHLDRSVEEGTYMEILGKLYLFPEIERLVFLHLWCTGLRISEVCTLKGDAYYWDGEDAWLKIYQIKMKADKMIPIPLVLYKVMQVYIGKNHIGAKDYIFKGKQGGVYRSASFTQSFKKNCKKYGIANCEYVFKSHDYRHTLATRFYDDGVPIQTVRDYLGHVTENMTKQYVDYMPKKIAKANEEYFKKPGNSLASAVTAKKRGEKSGKKNPPV